MKNWHLTIFFCFVFFTEGFAQQYKPTWGPSYKKEGGIFGDFELIGLEGDHYYMLMRPKKSNTLLKYDLNHKLVSNQKLDLKYGKEKITLQKLIRTRKGAFGYMTDYDPSKKKWQVFATPFNDGSFGKVKRVLTHDFTYRVKFIGFGFGYTNQDNEETMIESEDGSHVGYTSILSSSDSKKNEQLAIAVFDENLDIKWKKIQRFRYKDKKIEITQSIVSNNGVVYVLAKVITPKSKKKGSLPRYDYKAFKITEEGMKEFNIKLGGTNIAPLSLSLFLPDDEHEFVMSGIYTDAEKKSGVKGVFFASGDSETGINNTKTVKFDQEIIDLFATKKEKKKNRGINNNFKIENVVQHRDGTVSLVIEERYVTSTTTMDSKGRWDTDYVYHSNGIIIPRFTLDGELVKIQKIDKSFKSADYYDTSYSIAVYNNKIYLVYNDQKSRGERKEMKGKRGWIYTDMVVVDENGDIEFEETIFNSKEIKMFFIPSLSDYSNDVLLIGTYVGKKYAFGTIKL